jgi:hypothetical protein
MKFELTRPMVIAVFAIAATGLIWTIDPMIAYMIIIFAALVRIALWKGEI